MAKVSAIVVWGLLFSSIALAHGQDKPGPHGGIVQMPANFHVEVVPDGAAAIKVYLLDMEFKKPMVANSGIKIKITDSKKPINIKCQMRADYFHCKATTAMTSGILAIDATRDNVIANSQAEYTLPLKH